MMNITEARAVLAFAGVFFLLVACQGRAQDVVRFEQIQHDDIREIWMPSDSHRTVKRSRFVRYQPGLVNSLVSEGESVSFELFDNEFIPVDVMKIDETSRGQTQISGTIVDEDYSVFWVTASDSGLIGKAQTSNWMIAFDTVEKGVVRISEYDQGAFPPDVELDDEIEIDDEGRSDGEHAGELRRESDAEVEPVGGSKDPGTGRAEQDYDAPVRFTSAVERTAGLPGRERSSLIRVLLVLPGAEYRNRCDPALLGDIASSTEFEINQVWRTAAQSEAVATCVNHMPQGQALVDYLDQDSSHTVASYEEDTGADPYPDLTWLKSSEAIEDLRDGHEADLVVMVVPVFFACGAAGTNKPPVEPTEDHKAFAVVREDCVAGNYSIQHELGHLLGMRHDRHAYTNAAASACNYGYQCRAATGFVGRTVMASLKGCKKAGFNSSLCRTRYPFHSTIHAANDVVLPDTSWICGKQCTATTDDDNNGPAHNYVQLQAAAPVVSQYR